MKLPVVEGIERQAVGIEAKSVALCSLPGSVFVQKTLWMFVFPK